MGLLFTQRGIPQLYYGTEILMKNFKNPSDAEVRRDFPGGWAGDAENKFVAGGRTAQENEAYNYVKALAQFRMHSSAIRTGKTMQYVPVDGMYVYFRYDAKQTVMCVLNTSDAAKEIDFSKYAERTNEFGKAINIISNTNINVSGKVFIPAKTIWVLELKK